MFARNFNRGFNNNFFNNNLNFNDPFFANRINDFNFSRGVPLDPNFQLAALQGGFGFNNPFLSNGFNNGFNNGFDNGFNGGVVDPSSLGGFGGFGNFNQGFDPRLRIIAANGGAFALNGNGQAFEIDPRFLGQNGQLNDPTALSAFYSGDVNRLQQSGVFRQELFRTNNGQTDQIIPAFGRDGSTLPQTQQAIRAYQTGAGNGRAFLQ